MTLLPRLFLSSCGRLRRLPRLAVLALAVAAGPALAERWMDAVPASETTLLQWDADSVAPAGANRLSATWRVGTAPGRPYFLKKGVVDCAGESLQIGTSTYVETDPSRQAYSSAMTDYAAGTRTWQGRSSRLTRAERAEGNEFPVAGEPAGRLVQLVCGERGVASTAQSVSATALQSGSGCASASTSVSAGCTTKEAAPPAGADSLGLRIAQVQQACVLSSAQASRLRHTSMAQAKDCAHSAAGCSAPPLQAVLAGLGSDLARAAAGQACAYVPEALARATDDAFDQAATARFQACVTRSVPELDDRVSPADVVAKGVYGACRGELPPEIAQGPIFANGLLPGLTAAVLTHRSRGRATLPTKPKRSQAD